MKHFVGIDLGTTNSVICSFEGENVRLYKSPEQNDVTPSAIFIDRRGNKYIGKRAYDNAPWSPDNAATIFKRLMGTSTPIRIPAANLKLTPEECSAEILRVLYGYLPEEIRNAQGTGTVVTVPAAFNQMQKDATLAAAEMAGIGKVALMQEPVAAVMSVMHNRKTDGVFLIFDMGGGTLDVALAQSISGRVSLLSHGGIEMCGGRDFDRILFDNIVKPWLLEKFDLAENFESNGQYKSLGQIALWATEKAKIDLSSKEEAIVSLDENQVRVKDRLGADIYLDIPLSRRSLDFLILKKIADAIRATRDTVEKAGLSPQEVERIVFVGGPTSYKPLRDKVSMELGIPGDTNINPMTAVAEGAALFAESIDWDSQSRGRKSARGVMTAGGVVNLSLNYIARTPDIRAKIALLVKEQTLPGTEFQIDSLDSGWSSGRLPLQNEATVTVMLPKSGTNTFKIFVFDAGGGPVHLQQDRIEITRTAATVDAIPASQSIGIEVLEKIDGRPTLDYLVKTGDPLPYKGTRKYKAAESLRAGGAGSLNFRVREGDIDEPITDNRVVGTLKICGSDFDVGVIVAGADMICEYEVRDSGNVIIQVTVPDISGTFHSGHNFYSRQEGQIDFTTATHRILDECGVALDRIEKLSSKVDDPKLDQAMEKLKTAGALKTNESDPETCKQAMDNVQEAIRLLAEVRKQNSPIIRQLDLDNVVDFFDGYLREKARPAEATAFENLKRTAQRAIDRNDSDFENHLNELRNMSFGIMWRQDWFIIDKFKSMADTPHLFPDQVCYKALIAQGAEAINRDDIVRLREIVSQLYGVRLTFAPDDDMAEVANILRG